MQYTARDGGEPLKTAVQGDLRQSLNKIADILAAERTGLTRIISAAHEFSTEWHRFMYPTVAATSQELALKLDKHLFPFMLKERRLNIQEIKVVFILDDPALYRGTALTITFTHPDGSQATGGLAAPTLVGDQPGLTVSSSFALEQEPKEIAVTVEEVSLSSIAPALVEVRDGKQRLNTTRIEDVLLVLNYTIPS